MGHGAGKALSPRCPWGKQRAPKGPQVPAPWLWAAPSTRLEQLSLRGFVAGSGCGSPPEGRDPSPAPAPRGGVSSASPMHEKWILLQMLPLNHWGEIRCPQLLISDPGVPWHALRSLHAPEQLEGTLGLPQSSRRGDQCPNPELVTKRCPQGAPSSEDTTKCPFTPSGRGEEPSLQEERLGGCRGPCSAAPPAPEEWQGAPRSHHPKHRDRKSLFSSSSVRAGGLPIHRRQGQAFLGHPLGFVLISTHMHRL